MPQELKDQMLQEIQQSAFGALLGIIGDKLDAAYAAGVASVPQGGFSQADLDAAKEQGKSEGKAEAKDLAKAAIAALDADQDAQVIAAIDSI